MPSTRCAASFPEDDDAPPVVERQEADGLPVRIVPGTRVTEAQAVPPAPPRTVVTKRTGSTAISASSAIAGSSSTGRCRKAARLPQ